MYPFSNEGEERACGKQEWKGWWKIVGKILRMSWEDKRRVCVYICANLFTHCTCQVATLCSFFFLVVTRDCLDVCLSIRSSVRLFFGCSSNLYMVSVMKGERRAVDNLFRVEKVFPYRYSGWNTLYGLNQLDRQTDRRTVLKGELSLSPFTDKAATTTATTTKLNSYYVEKKNQEWWEFYENEKKISYSQPQKNPGSWEVFSLHVFLLLYII